MSELNAKYADQFWSLANITVGFAVGTTLSFLLADSTWKGAIACGLAKSPGSGIAGISIALIIYLIAAGGCQWASWKLTFPDKPTSAVSNYIWWCNGARFAAILLISMFASIPVLAHQDPAAVCGLGKAKTAQPSPATPHLP
jgi:hypothetical protein